MSEKLIETVKLPANLCPKHKGGEFTLLGTHPGRIEDNQDNNSILVPADSSPWWKQGLIKGVVIIMCNECVAITLHKPVESSDKKHGWTTIPPTGWRKNVQIVWSDALTAEDQHLYNIQGLSYLSRCNEIIIHFAIDRSKKEIIHQQSYHFHDLWGSYIADKKRRFIKYLHRVIKDTAIYLPDYAEGLLYQLGQFVVKNDKLVEAVRHSIHVIQSSKTFCKSSALKEEREYLEKILTELGFALPAEESHV